jgi:P27 family predicted phage terminase small subunit
VALKGRIPASLAARWMRSGIGARPAVAKGTAPAMPRDLPKGARQYWRRLVPQLTERGVNLQPEDAPALGDLCLCLARLAQCEREITEQGVVVESYRGGKARNPALMAAGQYRQQFLKLAARFGLTPIDRARLELPEPEREEGRLSDYLFAATNKGKPEREESAAESGKRYADG